jgi:NAD(P)-dependent dehydrogenase (short-subunit alcohol dehydrogenase family)
VVLLGSGRWGPGRVFYPAGGASRAGRRIMSGMERAKVVLVTRAGQGYGRAIALAYGQAGYNVVCADRNVELASRTAAEIERSRGQAIPIQADPTASLDVQAAFGKVWEIYGSLSGVVHVTDYESATPFHHLGAGELQELFEETVHSTVHVLKATLRAAPGAWVVIVAPAPASDQPHVAAVGGAIGRLAAAFPAPAAEPADPEAGDPFASPRSGLRVNVVVPSRPASDGVHDAPLVHAVRLMGGDAGAGIRGAELAVTLPPAPKESEALLPEVRAALDDTLRQEDYDDASDFGDEIRGVDLVVDERLDDASLAQDPPDAAWEEPQEEIAAAGWQP